MGSRKVGVDFDNVCDVESKVGLRSCGGVFSSRIDMLASRADILNGKDRALMKMYLKNGATFRQMAQVAGTNEATIARRIHKLTSRLIVEQIGIGQLLGHPDNPNRMSKVNFKKLAGHIRRTANDTGNTEYK